MLVVVLVVVGGSCVMVVVFVFAVMAVVFVVFFDVDFLKIQNPHIFGVGNRTTVSRKVNFQGFARQSTIG